MRCPETTRPISIHALRVEGDQARQQLNKISRGISIHALRVEGDGKVCNRGFVRPISIHALRVEGDCRSAATTANSSEFLSTPSVWRATVLKAAEEVVTEFLSTPSVWRATFSVSGDNAIVKDFYPRPPCGGRPGAQCTVIRSKRFLSTPSVWRATPRKWHNCNKASNFYPRPPCGGRPPAITIYARLSANFYPRPPCGGRQVNCSLVRAFHVFLSTPSVWRATRKGKRVVFYSLISIHALRVEGDRNHGGSPVKRLISIHALRVEGD